MTDPKTTTDEVQAEAEHIAEAAMSIMPPTMGNLANTESARAIAQVQAAALLARTYKRDADLALEEILVSCDRYTLAQKATYVYSRGGEEISGPTIRLAEAVVQSWGNMRAGIREVSRDIEEGVSVCVAYAHDLQTGLEDEKEFYVRHWRDIKGGRGYRVKSERDIGELVANFGARRKRACIQAVVPAYVFEEAVERCEQTLYDNIRTDEAACNDMLKHFDALGITKEHIEARIRRPVADILAAQMIALHKIYNSLKGQDSAPADWFDIIEAADAADDGGTKLADIVARSERRQEAQKAKPVKGGKVIDDIERLIVEADTIDKLNKATLKIGPLTDMVRKGHLYEVAQQRHDELKKT